MPRYLRLVPVLAVPALLLAFVVAPDGGDDTEISVAPSSDRPGEDSRPLPTTLARSSRADEVHEAKASGGPKGKPSRTTTTTTSTTTTTAPSTSTTTTTAPQTTALLSDHFDYPDGIITNEYAHWNPTDPSAFRNPLWELTSGTLYASSGRGWSGPPEYNPSVSTIDSEPLNNSAIFRMRTIRNDFGDVDVSFRLRIDQLSSTEGTPAVAWDGVHVFLRYHTEEELYYVSVNRRDDKVVIKKKVPGGSSNGGTYYTLATAARVLPYGSWQDLTARVVNLSDGSVRISLHEGGKELIAAVDQGTGGPPLGSPGHIGIRGDNAEFLLDDVVVTTP